MASKAKPKRAQPQATTPAERLDLATLRVLDQAAITLPDGTPWVRPDWMQANLVEAPLTLKADGTPRFEFIYLEAPKGVAKTFATVMVHLAEALVHGDTLIVIAGRDRGAIQPDVDFLSGAIKRSPLLRTRCHVLTDMIRLDGGSRIEFWPADERGVHGSGGAHARFRVLLEDPHAWAAHELMDSMLATSGKVANTRVTVLTNPGPKRSGRLWALRTQAKRQHAKTAWAWMPWSEGHPPEVPWLSEEWRARMRETLPSGVFARYVEGKWSEDSSFVQRAVVEACVGEHRSGMGGAGCVYAGLDLGIRQNHAALAWGQTAGGRFYLHGFRRWVPALLPQREVVLDEVQQAVCEVAKSYTGLRLFADPMQAIQMAQALRRDFGEAAIVEFSFGLGNQVKLAAAFFEGLTKRLIALPADTADDLVEEISSLDCVPVGYGYRFEGVGEAGGHGDVAVAVSLAYLAAQSSPWGLGAAAPRPLKDAVRVGPTRDTAKPGTPFHITAHALGDSPSPWASGGGRSVFDLYDAGRLPGQAGGSKRRAW